jgi:hypothetical protein
VGFSAVIFGAMGIAGAAIVSDSHRVGCFDHNGPLRAVLTVLVPASMAAAGGAIGALASRRVRAGSLAAQSRRLLAWCAGGLCVAMGSALTGASRPSPECVRASDETILCVTALIGELASLVAASATAATFPGRRALCSALLRRREQPGPSPVPGPISVDLGVGDQVRTGPCPESPYRHAVAREVYSVADPVATLRSLQLDLIGAFLCAVAAAGAAASFALR